MADRWKADETAEARLRAALIPSLRFVSPIVLLGGVIWAFVDLPGGWLPAAVISASGVALAGLSVLWDRHPPRSAHAATALALTLLYLVSMSQLIAAPDPALGSVHLIVVMAAAVYLVDLRWLIAMQLVGAATWLLPVALAPRSLPWEIQGPLLLVGLAAALTFRRVHASSVDRVPELNVERDEREPATQAANRALHAAQRIAGVGSYEWDASSGDLRWSDEHLRIFGWSPDDPVTSRRFFEAVHPDDRPALAESFVHSLRSGAPVDLEFRIRRPNGEERVVHGRGETTFDDSGAAVHHTGTSHDVTDRHRAAERLRASEERLRAILAAMGSGRVVDVARDGTLRSILGESERTGRYGVEPEEIPGAHIRDFLPGEPGERLLEAVQRTYATGAGEEIEAAIDFPHGSFEFDVSLRALRGATGEIESVLAVVRDVTQRRAAERSLQQAQKLESLGVLAGGIAHDFNNLLVGILGNSELALLETPRASPLRQTLATILRASERAAELTDQLLAYAGKAEVAALTVDLQALASDTTELLRSSIPASSRIAFHPCADPVWVHADSTQLRQVLMNFITNASESFGGRPGQIGVRTEATTLDRLQLDRCQIRDGAEPGAFALLEVRDDGSGMDPATTSRMFEPFFTTKFQGRGLGLAATLGIVQRHRGAIHVDSEPGKGTTIRLFLPLAAAAASPVLAPRTAGPARAGRILVVDDEPVVRSAATRMLEASGFDTEEASTGTEAIDAVTRSGSDFCAVLLDVTMPDLDGEQTLAELRASRPALPIVFMSGHSQEDMARRLLGKTRVRFVKKPFRMSELLGAIQAALAEGE